MEEQKPHFLLVSYPVQSHINPALQFAKRLLQAGATVTFTTTVSAHRRLSGKANFPNGLNFATISDGYDDDFHRASNGDVQTYHFKFRQHGANSLAELFKINAAQGKHVTCLVYTLTLPWAAVVARGNRVPTALLWIQPATVFDVYYYYFNGYKDNISDCEKNPSWSLKLPNLPFELKVHDVPSILLPSTPYPRSFIVPTFEEQIEVVDREENPIIFVNTFDALEHEALRSIKTLQLIPVGPLLPSAFLDGKNPLDKSFGMDLFHCRQDDYMDWLEYQERSSVTYVSFGSLLVLPRTQMEELGKGLLLTHRPFLWVIREKVKQDHEGKNNEVEEEEEEELSCLEELKENGMIVPWCSQVEVLSHPSIGCFVTHCGWNSTLESITSGVPMVAFPRWCEQTTNAKLVEAVWKVGVRVKVSEEDGLVKSEELKRCLEVVMESEEIRENAKRWRDLAVEAANEGGSSDTNLRAFIKERGC